MLTYDDAVVCQLPWRLLLQVAQQTLRGLLDGDRVHAVEPWAHLGTQASRACSHADDTSSGYSEERQAHVWPWLLLTDSHCGV
jgi:hypothetical protein